MIIPEGAPNVLVTLAKMNLFEFMPVMDLSLKIGFQFKLAGYDWRSNEDLASILGVLTNIGFIQIHPDVTTVTARVNPVFRSATSTASLAAAP